METEKFQLEVKHDFMTDKATATISLVNGKDPIIAFVTLDFGFLKIKGITIKEKDFNNDGNKVLSFDLPAYRTGHGYNKSVYIPNKQDYLTIATPILERVKAELSQKNPPLLEKETEVDPKDIPF